MVDFFLSPADQKGIERERLNRQRRFESARQQAQANPDAGYRLMQADQLNPQASNELKQSYALSPMTDEQFLELSRREAEQVDNDPSLVGRIGNVLNKVGMGFYDQVFKPAIRGAFAVVDTAAQEVVQRPLTAVLNAGPNAEDTEGMGLSERLRALPGQVRENYNEYGDSPGLNLLQGDRATMDEEGFAVEGGALGHGFFPAGEFGQRSEQEKTLEVRGQEANFGRSVANGLIGEFYAPGDKAYDITAGVAQFAGDVALDPVAIGTMGATRALAASKGLSGVRTLGQARRGLSIEQANQARQTVLDLGLVSTSKRNTVLFEQTERLFKDPKILEDIAGMDSYQIMRRLKLDRVGARGDELADLVNRLGDANTPQRVADELLNSAREGLIRERGFYAGSGKFVPNPREAFRNLRLDKNLPEFRYGGLQPTGAVSATNRMQAATDIDNMLRLAKVGEADRAGIVSRALRVEGNDDLIGVVGDSVRAIGSKMTDVGVKPERVDELLDSWKKQMNQTRSYLLDETGRHSPPPWKGKPTQKIHGVDEEVAVPTASMISHLNSRMVPLPDPKDVRQATVKYDALRAVYESAGWEVADSAARFVNRYLFKFPTLFTRIAYPLRNNLDNQARAAGAGHHSIFTNPKAWMSLGVRDPHKFRDIVSNEDFNVVAREIGALTNDASGMWSDDGAKALGAWRTYTRGVDKDGDFIRAWRGELGRMTNDGIAPLVADTARWGNRDELITHIIDNGLVDEVSKLGDDAKRFFMGNGTRPDRAKVSEYVEYLEGHIDNLTNGEPGLRRLIATADLNGTAFNDLKQAKRVDQILREQYLETSAPRYVSGDTFIEEGTKATRAAKKGMNWMVDIMASRPENRFTRFPLLAETFADDLARLMPSLADDTLRQQLVKRAADAGFDDKLFPQIAQAAQDAAGQRGVTQSVDDLVDAAKLHSSDRMLDIAFDATQRSSLQEMADVIMPFYDAWVEVGKSWAKILRDNPAAFSRGTAAYSSARGQGLFYANEHGEEVFSYPGGGMIAKALGIQNGSVRLEGRVEGLNLLVQGIGPGFGPMVQWASGAFLPDTPDLQWVRDLVTPFGTSVEKPSDLARVGKLADDLMPAWMEKAFNAWSEGDIDEVAFNSAVGDALKVLATTGNYQQDAESQRKLVDDAEKAARWTTFLRSAVQMGAPTGPSIVWEIEGDEDGTWHRINTMAGAYYDLLQETGDSTTANMAFIEMYGVEPFWIAQGKTRELREGPRTREGFSWIQNHSEAAERHADVVGYFVPAEDPLDTGDYGVYRQRLAQGDIESLTGEQQLALANKTKARAIYYAWKDRLAELPTAIRQREERLIRATLDNEFPGWQADVLGVSSKLDRDEKIRLLSEAVQDPALADSPVTDPLSAYLSAREQAFAEIARRGGPTTLGAQANADLREWLFRAGQQIVAQNEHFQGVWQTVLSSEVDQ